jgi:hypothetical protein
LMTSDHIHYAKLPGCEAFPAEPHMALRFAFWRDDDSSI